MRYAEVVVNHRLSRHPVTVQSSPADDAGPDPRGLTFSYYIPPLLEDQIQPGQLVRVSFGPRWVQGVVLAIHDVSPVSKTKPIDAILDPEPVLSEAHIALARWMSTYYVAPLMECVRLMLPPGISRTSITLIELGPHRPFNAYLSPQERAILERVRRDAPIPLDQLTRAGGKKTVERMIEQGILVQRYGLKAPRARPKVQRIARLIVEPDESLYRELARAPVQTAMVELLAEEGPLPITEIVELVGGSPATLQVLQKKEIVVIEEQEIWRDPLEDKTPAPDQPPILTPAQQDAWQAIQSALTEAFSTAQATTCLLHGVTGSGKTEIYLRAIAETLRQGRQAIVLVPEISLTPQTIQRLTARFPHQVALMHSALSMGERFDTWRRIRAGELPVVVGARSALFAPVRRPGLIVIDEEHEWSYKQDVPPRYHARDVALHLARLTGICTILGSATPAVESYFAAQQGLYRLVEMPYRVMTTPGPSGVDTTPVTQKEAAPYADLPPVRVVDMRQELRAGNRSIFSRPLQQALQQTLEAGHQAILFLNRRGASNFVMCRDCGHVLHCPRCAASLTYHAEAGLICHHCNQRAISPQLCPHCASPRIKHFGIGTQRIEEMVRQLFPQARVIRWDQDTTRRKGAHEHLLQQFVEGKADIMVGTQMVAKGLDLPLVTLVGVVAADTGLHLPDFRAAERTFQLLTQVAGRAGRSSLGGQVVVQTYNPTHYAIQAASRHRYLDFYKYELAFRREQHYPPFARLVRLLYLDTNPEKAQAEAERMAGHLHNKIARLGLPDTTLIGPAPAFLERIRGRSRWQILIRATDPHPLLADLRVPAGWQIDVDPVNLL